MPQHQDLALQQRIQQRLSLQQLQFVKLLELSEPEMEQAVELELAENPALEKVGQQPEEVSVQELTDDGRAFRESAEQMQTADYSDPDDMPWYPARNINVSADDYVPDYSPADTDESIYEVLGRQLSERRLDTDVMQAALYIIGSLDSNGYLRRSRREIADDMAFSLGVETDPATLEQALETVRSLEPHGIGAFDLRDALLMQARALPASRTRDDAVEILDRYFSEFALKHSHRIISMMGISAQRVDAAMELIRGLNPKPGAQLGTGVRESAPGIIPDFIISVEDGSISVGMPGQPELVIEESFESAVSRMLRNAETRAARKGNEFILSRFNAARSFIKLVRQRRETLFSVMTAIVSIQREYFLTQDVHSLRPMMIKDVAAVTGYDISVISRATANKYAATPWGVFPLRFFFSDSLGSEGEEVTRQEIEQELREIIDGEDKRHPLSDENLRATLREKGYDVSRRTIAKYRDRLRIPVARLRKE